MRALLSFLLGGQLSWLCQACFDEVVVRSWLSSGSMEAGCFPDSLVPDAVVDETNFNLLNA